MVNFFFQTFRISCGEWVEQVRSLRNGIGAIWKFDKSCTGPPILSKVIWMRWLLVRQSLVSYFYVRINFSEEELNLKASCKTIRKWWFCNPSKTYQSLVENLFGPMSFDEIQMGGNKIENLPIILEAKLRLMYKFSIKVYVGNTPQNHCLMMMGHCQSNFFWLRPNKFFVLTCISVLDKYVYDMIVTMRVYICSQYNIIRTNKLYLCYILLWLTDTFNWFDWYAFIISV